LKALEAWKQKHALSDAHDDIIFGEDEEIHEGIKLDMIQDKLNLNASQGKAAYQPS
jgi:hypothetical protein